MIQLSVELVRSSHLLSEVRQHCEAYHYLHRWPDARSLPFAYVLQVDGQSHVSDGRLYGLVVMKKLQHHQQQNLFGYPGLPTAWQALDLARVWIHPALQDERKLNVFSRMVGRVIRRVQFDWLEHHPPRFPDRPYHIELIVSYCELAHHDGTAYRASNFTRFGVTSDGTKEIYVRRLKPPRKRWQPVKPYQPPLFDGFPLGHG